MTTSVTDVTVQITGGIDPKATDRQRLDLVERRVKEKAACEKSGQRCTVASFFEGHKYFEYCPARNQGRAARLRPHRGHR